LKGNLDPGSPEVWGRPQNGEKVSNSKGGKKKKSDNYFEVAGLGKK